MSTPLGLALLLQQHLICGEEHTQAAVSGGLCQSHHRVSVLSLFLLKWSLYFLHKNILILPDVESDALKSVLNK